MSIAETYGVSWKTAKVWTAKRDFPKSSKSGWRSESVNAWVERHNEERAKSLKTKGDKAEKLRLECDRLRVVIDREKENLKQARLETARQRHEAMMISEVRQTLSEICAAVKGGLNAWCSRVAAEAKDSKVLEWAEGIRDQVLRDIQTKLPTKPPRTGSRKRAA